MCAFLRKTNGTSMFISMMRMIFIFGFAKKYLSEKSYVQSKMHPCVPDQMCIQIIEGNAKGLRRGGIHTSHCPFITPLHFLLWSGCTSDPGGTDASLIWRNFFYTGNKYFLANPKIKIIRIIEINTLVPLVFRKKARICSKPPNLRFFRLLSGTLEGGLGQYSES